MKYLKRFILSLFVALTCIASASSQQGIVLESLQVESEILDKTVEYSIYLPYDYDVSQRKYPVLYLLHGYTDDETGWVQFGEVKAIADGLIGHPEVTPMVIVMPDAGVDWYINSYDGKVRYEDFFIEEFIPFIEKEYRARGSREFRAVAGLSMGGFGTLNYALKHPGLFAAAAPLSAAVWGEEAILNFPQERWEDLFSFIFGENLLGEERLTDHLKNNMPLMLARTEDTEALKTVRWYIDCGDDDFLINGNMELHRILNEREIPHEFRVRDGGHTWDYWRTALPEVLKFVSQSFHR